MFSNYKQIIGVILWLLCSLTLQAQIIIQGTITDRLGMPIQGVSALLNPQGKSVVLAYSISDEKGHYQLSYNGEIDSLQIALSSFNYEKAIRNIPKISQTIDFSLKIQAIELEEVIVKAAPISQKGDTLKYLVSSFATESDRVIGDVLKKLPGIEVLPGGSIQYNGKDINKFYVENLDLLQGRYGIATNNISAKDVASVEVYEYHQPIRALTNISSTDRAAINLKLKDSAKGILSATAQLGIGGKPLIWDNELISLYFDTKRQNINTYKGNNSGNDVSQELTAFYSESGQVLEDGKILSILSPTPPNINNQRYLFNNIHSFTANVLSVLPNQYELTANVNYYNDQQNKDGYSYSSYYLSNDSILTINEMMNSIQSMDHLDASVKIITNQDDYYLVNALKLNASWDRSNGNIMAMDTIYQKLQTNKYNLSNTFKIIKTLPNEKIIEVSSFNGYGQTPQNLTINPGLYNDVLTNGQPFDHLLQNTLFDNFLSKTYFFFSTSKKRFTQNYIGGFDANVQALNSSLHPLSMNLDLVEVLPDSLKNDLHWQKYKSYITGEYIYSWLKFRIEVSLSASHNFFLIRDKNVSQKQTLNRVLLSPEISVNYKFHNYWTIKADYNFEERLGTIQNSYTGYILQNYRNFNRNEGQLADYQTSDYLISVSYRNPLKALFANIRFLHERLTANMLRDQSFIGILQVQNTINMPITSLTNGVNGSISKYIYDLHTTTSLAANYFNISSSQMNQGKLVDYRYDTYRIKLAIESQLNSWANISCSSLWTENQSRIENGFFNYPAIRTLSNRFTTRLFPINKLGIIIDYEHYYDSTLSEKKNMSFVDLKLTYKWKEVELALDWSNILNSKEYIASSFDGANKFTYLYEIRPSQILLTANFKL